MDLGGLMAQRCPRCGTNNRDESRFCLYCGATLSGLTEDGPRPAVTAPISTPSSPIRLIPRPAPRERAPDFVGLLGVAFFLLVLGVVFYLNQNLLTDLRQWWDQIVAGQLLFRPPEGVISSAVGFWALIGVTNFVVAALRWSLRRTKIHTLGAALGGIGAIAFAYLLYRYSLRELSGSQLVSFEAAVLAILLFVYIGLGLHWTSTRRRLAYEAARRSPR
ncbi:MAG TPA: zinc ribbon domain-containing protein [Thermoplasmata archaeon]|nr:zinc ribbon domain-containing protein [Thermoplasmata archaeon]